MRVLLDEHETILNRYQVQKYGGGEGSTGEVVQGVSRMLGRELAGKKKDWLLAHGAMRSGRVVGKWGETEKGSHVKEASI
jgi:hypothetical protein